MSTVLTSKLLAPPRNDGLQKLAERWRPLGLALACLRPDGVLLWHDAAMPRALALCLTHSDLARRAVERAAQHTDAFPASSALEPFRGVALHLVPIVRRRRLTAWLAVLARTGTPVASEELHRAAGRTSQDVTALLQALQRTPLTPADQLPTFVNLAAQMLDDLQAGTGARQELASITEQLSSVYEEISLVYKISGQMRFSQDPRAFLGGVCRELLDSGNYRAVAIALAHRPEDSAQPVIGELAVQAGTSPLGDVELINALHDPLQACLRLGEAQVHNSIAAAAGLDPRLTGVLERFVCVPLMRDRRPLGVLLAMDKHDHGDFNSVDLKLLGNVAGQCTIFLENAALYQDMHGLFMGVLQALTRSIDAKDAYTRGHSQRVADLSRALARKIGLADELCERVYLSGLLHDVGKIGVPEYVLTKPGRLTDTEFEAIKKHPEIGAEILGTIKQLQDVVPGVLYHHERWDATGYPYGLGGDHIPLMGRIICVADSFDAMSSTRTYRPALPVETVLNEIRRCAGTQFDPALAAVFVTLDFTGYRLAIEKQLQAGTIGYRAPELPAAPHAPVLAAAPRAAAGPREERL
jgi:putative nucleotidyltransferase with HDIG domain